MEEDMEPLFNFSFISDNLTFLFNSTYDLYPPDVSTIALIPFMIVCLVGLLGNLLVLSIILWSKKMWRTMNVFVFCLALGDLLYMLCLMVLVIELMSPLGTFLCILYWMLTALTTFSNVYFLAIMSITVFLQMYFPAFSKKLSIKVAALTSLGIWIMSLLLAIPFFIYADVDDEYSNCRIHWPDSFWNIIFTSYRFALAFLAPLAWIAVLLILTQCRARRQDQATDSTVTGVKEDTVMVMVLTLIFIVFWLPTHVLDIMSEVTSDRQFSDGSYYAITIVPYLKSCVYPFAYGFLSKGFKHWYNRIFCCKKVHEGDGPPKNSNQRQEDKSTAY